MELSPKTYSNVPQPAAATAHDTNPGRSFRARIQDGDGARARRPHALKWLCRRGKRQ